MESLRSLWNGILWLLKAPLFSLRILYPCNSACFFADTLPGQTTLPYVRILLPFLLRFLDDEYSGSNLLRCLFTEYSLDIQLRSLLIAYLYLSDSACSSI